MLIAASRWELGESEGTADCQFPWYACYREAMCLICSVVSRRFPCSVYIVTLLPSALPHFRLQPLSATSLGLNAHKLHVLLLFSRPRQFPPISMCSAFIFKCFLLNGLMGTHGQMVNSVGFGLGMRLLCLTLTEKLRMLESWLPVERFRYHRKSDQYLRSGTSSRSQGSNRPAHREIGM